MIRVLVVGDRVSIKEKSDRVRITKVWKNPESGYWFKGKFIDDWGKDLPSVPGKRYPEIIFHISEISGVWDYDPATVERIK